MSLNIQFNFNTNRHVISENNILTDADRSSFVKKNVLPRIKSAANIPFSFLIYSQRSCMDTLRTIERTPYLVKRTAIPPELKKKQLTFPMLLAAPYYHLLKTLNPSTEVDQAFQKTFFSRKILLRTNVSFNKKSSRIYPISPRKALVMLFPLTIITNLVNAHLAPATTTLALVSLGNVTWLNNLAFQHLQFPLLLSASFKYPQFFIDPKLHFSDKIPLFDSSGFLITNDTPSTSSINYTLLIEASDSANSIPSDLEHLPDRDKNC